MPTAGRTRSIFGICQGGTDLLLRAESAARTAELGFDGYGIGGLSVGEPRAEMLPALAAAIAELPADRPRYLMGVGDPLALVDGVALGVDQFDCVLPTRLGRHGTVLTSAGRLTLRRAAHADDPGPLDPACGCPVCQRWSRAYLRHLLVVGEPVAGRLVTLHNLAWVFALMERIRDAVAGGTLAALRAEIAAVWDPPPTPIRAPGASCGRILSWPAALSRRSWDQWSSSSPSSSWRLSSSCGPTRSAAACRRQRALLDHLRPGTRVVTVAGVIGTLMGIEGDRAAIEVAPGVVVEFLVAAIVRADDPTIGHPTAADEVDLGDAGPIDITDTTTSPDPTHDPSAGDPGEQTDGADFGSTPGHEES